MSAWTNAVDFHTPTLTSAQYAVLHALAAHANDDGVCWPSMAKIAHRAHCSERNAVRTIKLLCEAGYIRKEKRVRLDGGNSSNLYVISATVLECVEDCPCPIGRQVALRQWGGSKVSPQEVPVEENKGVTRTRTRTRTCVLLNGEKTAEKQASPDAQNRPQARPEANSAPQTLPAILESQGAPGISSPEPVKDRLFRVSWQMGTAWKAAYATMPPEGLIARGLGSLLDNVSPDQDAALVAAFRNYVNNTGAQYVSVPRFAATWGSWLRGVPQKASSELLSTMAAIEAVRGGE